MEKQTKFNRRIFSSLKRNEFYTGKLLVIANIFLVIGNLINIAQRSYVRSAKKKRRHCVKKDNKNSFKNCSLVHHCLPVILDQAILLV